MTAGRMICAACRHPKPLHGNGKTACSAKGCHSGPEGAPCAGFVTSIQEVPDVPPVMFQPALPRAV